MGAFQFEKAASIETYSTNPHILFVVGTVLGAISCFSRADYNLPMFAFLTVMWN